MAEITNEQMQLLLVMLENNLELSFEYYDEIAKQRKELELSQYLKTSANFIEREGITLNFENIDDLMLVTMYASWLYDERKNGVTIMPRALRYNLNNRLFAEKVNLYEGG